MQENGHDVRGMEGGMDEMRGKQGGGMDGPRGNK